MQFSTRARYGLQLMLQLAREADLEGNLSIGQIARKTRISRRYLEQLAIGLKNASLISGTTGREGGYRLSKPPGDITIRQIIEATIGPINVVQCVGEPEMCMKSDTCECRMLYALINDRVTGALEGFSLADMAGADWGRKIAGRTGKGRALPMVEEPGPKSQGVKGCPS